MERSIRELKRTGAAAVGALVLVFPLNESASADAQGWNGPGWYVSGSAPPGTELAKEPAYILFEGPHASQAGCLAEYDKLYSPIGVCRLLSKKPGN